MRRVVRWYSTEYLLVLPGEEGFEQPRALVDLLMFDRTWDNQQTLREVLATGFGHDVHRMNDHEVFVTLADLVSRDAVRLVEVECAAPTPGGIDEAEDAEPEREKQPSTTWIEVELLDEIDEPVTGVKYAIAREGGAVRSGVLDEHGLVRLTGIAAGQYSIGFPELDRDFWTGPGPATNTASTDTASAHVVQQGDCLESIAMEHGFFWDTLWSHADNRALRTLRKSRNVLYPKDVVHVPARRLKTVKGATAHRHTFHLRGVPSTLEIILRVDDEPRANTAYVLDVEGRCHEGTTDAEGRLKHPISPRARRGTLRVGEDADEVYEVALGEVDPIDEVSGVQARLNNLSYACGEEDGELDPRVEQALMDFQAHNNLEPTGQLDAATREKLLEQHAC